MSKLTYASSFRAGENKALSDVYKILTKGEITIDNLEKAINFIKNKLNRTGFIKDIKCVFCNSLINPDGKIKGGVCQIGQGKDKELLSFCSKEHLDLFEEQDALVSGDEQ